MPLFSEEFVGILKKKVMKSFLQGGLKHAISLVGECLLVKHTW